MKTGAVWYEIPVKQLERARKFYEAVFGFDFSFVELPGSMMYVFKTEHDAETIKGALVQSNDNEPSKTGTVVYFGCEDVSVKTANISGAGGLLIFGKTPIANFGYIAHFRDTEGNLIGLYSAQ